LSVFGLDLVVPLLSFFQISLKLFNIFTQTIGVFTLNLLQILLFEVYRVLNNRNLGLQVSIGFGFYFDPFSIEGTLLLQSGNFGV